MKIRCEKCQEDISGECCRNIENYQVGRVICPKCHYEQKRYISEADLLLYFAISEIIYIILSLLSMLLLNKLGLSIITIIIILIVLVLFTYLSKVISSAIYAKAYFKYEYRNTVYDEDGEAIKRNMTWQFMLFFVIVISFMTIRESRIFFAIAMPFTPIFTLIKFYLKLKMEKEQ